MLIVGTSGWMYDDWREAFYPPALARREWLGYYAAQLPAVELNNSFYRLPSLEQFESWASTVPVGFRFAVKVSRYLSHVKRLREPDEPIERFLEHAAGLGPAFGPSLLQLPPTLQCDPDRLRGVLRRWPTGRHRLAIEFRHESWFTDEVRRLLADANVALCLTDRRNHRPEPPWVTADWGYLRLHEGTATPWPTYGPQALQSWLERIASLWPATSSDVFVFFNNDANACAVDNARTMQSLARH